MTERGKAVFHQLVKNYETRMQDGKDALFASSVDQRMALKLPIKLNSISFLDKIKAAKDANNANKSSNNIPVWKVSYIPQKYKCTQENEHYEHLYNDCAIFRENMARENAIDYIVIRSINQEAVKYGETYNLNYFGARNDWSNKAEWMKQIFPDHSNITLSYNEDIQYPDMPQQASKQFKMYWGELDLSRFKQEYEIEDQRAAQQGIEPLALSEFSERYGRYPDKCEETEVEEFIYRPKSNINTEILFHGLLTKNQFYNIDGEGLNVGFSNIKESQDLRGESEYYFSYTYANPNSEKDLFATEAQITRVLEAVTELAPQEITQIFENLQEFEQTHDLLEDFLDNVIEYGKENSDLDRAIALAKKIAIKEERRDLVEKIEKASTKERIEPER